MIEHSSIVSNGARGLMVLSIVIAISILLRWQRGRRSATGRVSLIKAIAIGAGSGLVWGVLLRLWMRLISENPEFSWSGTLFIIGAPGVVGLAMAVAYAGRRNGWSRSGQIWASSIAGGSLILLAVGPGAIMVPAIALGGVAVANIRLPIVARIIVAAMLVATSVGTLGNNSWVVAGLAAAVATLVMTNRWPRMTVGGVAILLVGLVGQIVIDSDLPTFSTLGGTFFYPLLLVPVVAAFAAAVSTVATTETATAVSVAA